MGDLPDTKVGTLQQLSLKMERWYKLPVCKEKLAETSDKTDNDFNQ